MRKIILFIFCLLVFMPYSYSNSTNSEALKSAENLYKNQQYDSSVSVYKSLIDRSLESASLFYNLGNAYFKNEDLAHAILWYERAKILDYKDADINNNLAFAQSKQVDKVAEKASQISANMWYEIYSFFSTTTWVVISLILLIIIFVIVFMFMNALQEKYKKIIFVVGVFCIFCIVFSTTAAHSKHALRYGNSEAIIALPTVTIKLEPDYNSKDLTTIHEGLKVRMIETLDTWTRIELSDGKQGWVSTTDLLPIRF